MKFATFRAKDSWFAGVTPDRKIGYVEGSVENAQPPVMVSKSLRQGTITGLTKRENAIEAVRIKELLKVIRFATNVNIEGAGNVRKGEVDIIISRRYVGGWHVETGPVQED